MMTAEQRYRFDLHAYLHLRPTLPVEELNLRRPIPKSSQRAP